MHLMVVKFHDVWCNSPKSRYILDPFNPSQFNLSTFFLGSHIYIHVLLMQIRIHFSGQFLFISVLITPACYCATNLPHLQLTWTVRNMPHLFEGMWNGA